MKKPELVAQLKAFVEKAGILPLDIVVGAGGAMMALGLRHEIDDIDIAVKSSAVWTKIVKNLGLEIDRNHPSGKPVVVYGDIDCHLDPMYLDQDHPMILLDGYVNISTVQGLIAERAWIMGSRSKPKPKDNLDMIKLSLLNAVLAEPGATLDSAIKKASPRILSAVGDDVYEFITKLM